MFRIASLVAAAATVLAVSACTPAKPADGATATSTTPAAPGMPSTAEMQKAQQAAAAAALGALASDSSMTPEERAKAQAMLGNIAAGKVNPAASAYLTGLNKATAILGTIKDDATLKAAEAQLQPVFAEMKGPADQLNAMSKDDREIALGSSAPQIMQVSMTMMGSLMPVMMSNKDLGEKIDKLMQGMPEIKD